MTEIFTRKQYLDDREAYVPNGPVSAKHRRYYAQYVNESTVATVVRVIGIDRLKDSTDPYFNDIPMRDWDRMVGIGGTQSTPTIHFGGWFPFNNRSLELSGSKGYSCSDLICIAKEAARQAVEAAS